MRVRFETDDAHAYSADVDSDAANGSGRRAFRLGCALVRWTRVYELRSVCVRSGTRIFLKNSDTPQPCESQWRCSADMTDKQDGSHRGADAASVELGHIPTRERAGEKRYSTRRSLHWHCSTLTQPPVRPFEGTGSHHLGIPSVHLMRPSNTRSTKVAQLSAPDRSEASPT